MLLAHSSGLPGYARLFEVARDREALLDACLRLPLEASPGSRAEYSDPGFILLGRALEVIAGESLEDFCSREVFAPLGMTSTCFRPPADWRSAIPPTEEDLTFRHRIIQGEVQDENCFVLGGAGGHAGLFSNALDPLLYAQSLLRSGNSSRRKRFDSSPPASCRQTAPGRWDGIHLPSLPPPADSSAAIQPAISAMLELRCGSTSNASSPSYCLPIAPGRTARARPFVLSVPPSTMLSSKHWAGARLNCHNPKVFAWMARYALISEQSIVS